MSDEQTKRRPTESDYFDVLVDVLSPEAFRAILESARAAATDGEPVSRAWLFDALFASPLRTYATHRPGESYDLSGITDAEWAAMPTTLPSTPAAQKTQILDELLKEAREERARRKATEPAKDPASPEATPSSGPASDSETETPPRSG